jgi:hypothetical protein
MVVREDIPFAFAEERGERSRVFCVIFDFEGEPCQLAPQPSQPASVPKGYESPQQLSGQDRPARLTTKVLGYQ